MDALHEHYLDGVEPPDRDDVDNDEPAEGPDWSRVSDDELNAREERRWLESEARSNYLRGVEE